jgi:hypothetical protein
MSISKIEEPGVTVTPSGVIQRVRTASSMIMPILGR